MTDMISETGTTGETGTPARENLDTVTETQSDETQPTEMGLAPGPMVRRSGKRTALALVAFGAPIVLALVAVIALWGLEGGGGTVAPVSAGQTFTYVIPAGTNAKMESGQFVEDVLPEFVNLRVGDSIVVQNDDDATHTFGPITVRGNETTRVDFINPGIYFGLCTVGDHDSITIQVT